MANVFERSRFGRQMRLLDGAIHPTRERIIFELVSALEQTERARKPTLPEILEELAVRRQAV